LVDWGLTDTHDVHEALEAKVEIEVLTCHIETSASSSNMGPKTEVCKAQGKTEMQRLDILRQMQDQGATTRRPHTKPETEALQISAEARPRQGFRMPQDRGAKTEAMTLADTACS